MFKVKIYDALGLAYSEQFETLIAAQDEMQAQIDFIDSEKCYDWELQALAFTVQLISMEGSKEKILESVQA